MRGQAHTLEATVAGLLMLSSLIFALQMTAVTPLSASTSSQHIENQQQAAGEGALSAAASQGVLKPAILYWDTTIEEYHCKNRSQCQRADDYYTSGAPNRFGDILKQAFNADGIAYNVQFRYQTPNETTATHRYIYNGVATDNAVTATHTVVLRDDDPLYDFEERPTGTRISDAGVNHTIQDTGGNIYNTVRVEVIAWRI